MIFINQLEQAIASKEKELMSLKQELAALRKQLPSFVVEDYQLTNTKGKNVLLSELFGGKNELIVIHNMGKSCSYCTLWADGFSGFTEHLENKAAFVLTSPDDFQTLSDFSNERGWTFKSVSTKGTTFKEDLGFKSKEGFRPGVSILLKEEDGTIKHYTKAAFGPGDDYCSIWALFELLPEGSGDWGPKHRYEE
ncbi:DUF899 domain-containing protein [Mesobacillus boroniphilus]|uniref:DUF899 domain-containing protein n=1 Tax=Mesobacillus boroniphilus TaxID=308892 RepID=A0A944CI79_9BACI|nr:DUF899 family protein [Mesobacillus boroniphilus]MBS8263685.1 DUF899 domain-containing protein [Mesobacillus boroniphilus]